MFIKQLKLAKFYMFVNKEINLLMPQNDQKNVVNVLIGENGVGKTKLLEFMFEPFEYRKTEFSALSHQIVFLEKLNKIRGYYSDNELKIVDSNKKEHSITLGNISTAEDKLGMKSKICFISSQVIDKPDFLIHDPQWSDSKVIKSDQKIIPNSLHLISNAIISKERNIEIADAKERKQQAVEWFNQIFSTINIKSKLLELDEISAEPIFTDLSSENRLKFNELSSGEKQLYIKLATFILMNMQDSIILIDEPELSLHPEWQASFISLLKKIGSNNQFVIATHSPYIVSNLSPEDRLIVLEATNEGVTITENPQFNERDTNSTLDIMGYRHQLPVEVQELRKKYREYFDQKKEDSEDAQRVKERLLEYESLNSSFFQEINFLKVLRDEVH